MMLFAKLHHGHDPAVVTFSVVMETSDLQLNRMCTSSPPTNPLDFPQGRHQKTKGRLLNRKWEDNRVHSVMGKTICCKSRENDTVEADFL